MGRSATTGFGKAMAAKKYRKKQKNKNKSKIGLMGNGNGSLAEYNYIAKIAKNIKSTYSFVRQDVTTTITIGYGTSTGNYDFHFLSTKLNDLTNYTEITNLFDDYTIDYMSVKIQCPWGKGGYTASLAAGHSNPHPPTVLWYSDHNDKTTGTSVGQFRQRPGVRSTVFDKDINILFKPKPLNLIQQTEGGAARAESTTRGPIWINSAFPQVEHYGLHVCWDVSANALLSESTFIPIQIIKTIYFRARGVR